MDAISFHLALLRFWTKSDCDFLKPLILIMDGASYFTRDNILGWNIPPDKSPWKCAEYRHTWK